MLIDHEVKSSLFKYEYDKNPVISLIEKLKTNSYHNLKIKGELISYKTIKDCKFFIDPKQLQSELLEAIEAVKQFFDTAVKDAKEEIKNIISKYKESFSKSAFDKLEEYLSQTEYNSKLFSEIQDSYISNTEEISKEAIKLLSSDLQFKGEDFNAEIGLYLTNK